MSSSAAAQRRGADRRDAATGQAVRRLGSGLPFLVPFVVVALLFLVIPVL